MRLISQDGLIDVPYEYGSLSVGVGKVEEIEHAVIKYRNVSSPNGTKLAEYSSKSKALKVMEMLRKEYQKYYSNNGGGMMATANFYIQPFAFNHPKVFQFPSDEEVEV